MCAYSTSSTTSVSETRVDEFFQLVEGLAHTKRPIWGVAVVDEAAAAERAFQSLAPFSNIDRGTRRRRGPHDKAFTERVVPAGLLDHQLNEPRPIRVQIGTDLFDHRPWTTSERLGVSGGHDKCDRDAMLTEHSLHTDRTVTRPARRIAGAGERDTVWMRTTVTDRGQRTVRDLESVDPAVQRIHRTTRQRTLIRQFVGELTPPIEGRTIVAALGIVARRLLGHPTSVPNTPADRNLRHTTFGLSTRRDSVDIRR